MTPEFIIKAIGNLLSGAVVLIFLVFINFLLRKSEATIWGISLPAQSIHFILGPVLVVLNSLLAVYLFALADSELTSEQKAFIQGYQVKRILGPICNPFYLSTHPLISSFGYAFLIILWWLGMHSFTYSIQLGSRTPMRFGWQVLIGVVFLAVGLASMVGIQLCWQNLGESGYRSKSIVGFLGILIGAFLPPILLQLGLPKIFKDAQ